VLELETLLDILGGPVPKSSERACSFTGGMAGASFFLNQDMVMEVRMQGVDRLSTCLIYTPPSLPPRAAAQEFKGF
jgi:hypothetical protein